MLTFYGTKDGVKHVITIYSETDDHTGQLFTTDKNERNVLTSGPPHYFKW